MKSSGELSSFFPVGKVWLGAVTITLSLTACSDDALSPMNGGASQMPDPVAAAPRQIVEQADTLLMLSIRLGVQSSVPVGDPEVIETMTCSDRHCMGDLETVLNVGDLLDASLSPVDLSGLDGAAVESSGFHRAMVPAIALPPGALPMEGSQTPSVTFYGVWGHSGLAAVMIGDNEWVGRQGDVENRIHGATAMPFALGSAAAANPGGTGEAVWRGIVEAAAVSTHPYEHRTGTAEVRIPDLSHPHVSVAVAIDGASIGSATWADMELVDGRYGAGMPGHDAVQGLFAGSGHGDTWGVFDTDRYVGAFGAKRGQ